MLLTPYENKSLDKGRGPRGAQKAFPIIHQKAPSMNAKWLCLFHYISCLRTPHTEQMILIMEKAKNMNDWTQELDFTS